MISGPEFTLFLDIRGPGRGTQYDAIYVARTLVPDGTLPPILRDGYLPKLGERFQFIRNTGGTISGGFTRSALSQAQLPWGLEWDMSEVNTTGWAALVEAPTVAPAVPWWGLVALGGAHPAAPPAPAPKRGDPATPPAPGHACPPSRAAHRGLARFTGNDVGLPEEPATAVTCWNRPPLAQNALARLSLGSVRACGWLHEQLRLAAAGLTGHLPEVWDDLGPSNAWLGGSGEDWERGPYYARGLVALAHTLGDAGLLDRARPWIEWTLASQEPDGSFGPRSNADWWPRMLMLDALRLHHAATGDARVIPFMRRYAGHQLGRLRACPLEGWARPRGAENADSALWLYNQTGDLALLGLAGLLRAQTSDWLAECERDVPSADSFEFGHGVNRAMGLKAPLVWWQETRDARQRRAFAAGWETTLRHHGQVQGTFSGDEFLHGRGVTRGTELCLAVELLATLARALEITGEPWVADAIERIAYNALPAFLSPDLRAYQYYQLANQVECTPGGRDFHVHHETDLLFGPVSGYGCCAANLHLAWPLVVGAAWLASPDGGLVAALLAPSRVRARLAADTPVEIVTETRYPFEPEVLLTVRCPAPVAFPLRVRVPAWAEGAALLVNGHPAERDLPGEAAARDTGAARFVCIRRTWHDGDRVALVLPMEVRVRPWDDTAVTVERGPLVFALPIGEEWRPVGGTPPFPQYEVHPTTAWNYGLCVEGGDGSVALRTETRTPPSAQPWSTGGAPVLIRAAARRVPGWVATGGVAGPVPGRDLEVSTPAETLTLIPFGCARLRIAAFPTVRPGVQHAPTERH